MSRLYIFLPVFLMVISGVWIIFSVMSSHKAKLNARLSGLSGQDVDQPEPIKMSNFATTAFPKMGKTLVPSDEAGRTRLKSRLVYAGLYSRQAMPIFLGVKMLLMITPTLVGFVAGLFTLVPIRYGLLGGACLSLFGMVAPSFWLDKKKASRQTSIRRGLPDGLDLLIICLEGGLSLPGSLARISTELKSAHPELSADLSIVVREIQLGRTPGEAIQEMAKRTDLEEVRSLAAVIMQSDRFGASLVKSLHIHSDVLRQKRQQQAEEMGQKASLKVLFPTLLFIFPAIFVVILGPAAIHIYTTMNVLK